MSPKQYTPRSRDEIDAALAFIAQVESADARVESLPTDGASNDGSGIPSRGTGESVLIDGARNERTGEPVLTDGAGDDDTPLGPKRPRPVGQNMELFPCHRSSLSVSGNDLWECVFCNFEGNQKYRLLQAPPGETVSRCAT